MHIPFARFGTIHDRINGVSLAASALEAAATKRARALADAGARPGTVVAITHGGTARFFIDLLAVWSTGAAAACLDPALTESETSNVVAFCKPAIVVSADGTKSLEAAANADVIDNLDNAALLLFTSGTTGAPKGVALSFRAMLARLALNRYEIGTQALGSSLVTLPTHFGHGLIGNALTPLWAGGDITLVPRGLALAQSLGALIDEHRITFMSSVPSLWQMALRMSPPPKSGTLKRVHVGSAPLSAVLWTRIAEWCGCEVVNCYGITETANWIGGASSAEFKPLDGLIGRPWGGTAAIRDESGAIHASGSGEVLVQTPSLMMGYHERPDLTAAVLKDGWYATGDLGEVDESGCIRLTGRAKDEINRAGFKIQPAEIDMLLERHPDVAEACVFAIPDAVSGEIVAAAVRLAPGASANGKDLRDWCLKHLRREATPERWFIVDEIPKTSRGKVSRDIVRKTLVQTS
ncbi:MAG: fatty acid--CoA ligase family protein [Micropepsaceae bacterium]